MSQIHCTSSSTTTIHDLTSTTIMLASTPQLTEELKSLTNEATEAVADLSSPSTPAHISSPQTPRWLSLTPFKSVALNFTWESELEAEVEDALVFSDEEEEEFSLVGKDVDDDRDRTEWSPEPPDDEEPNDFEKGSERILAVLRCYLFNLEGGMLVTGSKVDSGVEAALKQLFGQGSAFGGCRIQEAKKTEMKESWEVSDEERVVAEIDSYSKELSRLQEDLPMNAEDVVKKILQWAKKKGTVNVKESMTSSTGSLRIIEC
jgi:hypothetical protein